MTMYVFCPRLTPGVVDLITALGAIRLRKFDGLNFWDGHRRLGLSDLKDDAILCWGGTVPAAQVLAPDMPLVINGLPFERNKLEELQILNGRVPTVYFSEHSPYPGEEAQIMRLSTGAYYWVSTPTDLRTDYQVHYFSSRVIRTEVKDASGSYVECPHEVKLRPITSLAIKALELTFGVVKLFELASGRIVVRDVITTPDITKDNLACYVKAINRLVKAKMKLTSVNV